MTVRNCPYCNAENNKNASVCKNCSKPLLGRSKLGIWLVVPVILCCIIAGIAAIASSTPEYRAEITQTAEWINNNKTAEAAAAEAAPDSSIKVLMTSAELSEEEAQEAFDIITNLGFERVLSMVLVGNDESASQYRANLGYTTPYLITIQDHQITRVNDENIIYYDQASGGVLDKITNYSLSTEDQAAFITLAQRDVLQALKSPSSAEFPSLITAADQWKFARDHDLVWVQAWVDAPNSFNVVIRNKFIAQYSYSSQELIYLEVDGSAVFGAPAK